MLVLYLGLKCLLICGLFMGFPFFCVWKPINADIKTTSPRVSKHATPNIPFPLLGFSPPGLFEPGGYSLRNQAKGMLEVLRLAVCSEFDSRVSVRPSNIPLSHTYDSLLIKSHVNTLSESSLKTSNFLLPPQSHASLYFINQ